MINTLTIKQQQLLHGFFKSGSGETKILIMGSCRVCPYVNYFVDWNNKNGNKYTIYSIDPFSWNWDLDEQRTDYDAIILSLETHTLILNMLKECDIFIHEFYRNSGMFNVDKSNEKNIYNFGMNAGIDICIPSWNDVFVLFQDIVNFDTEIRKKSIQDYNVIGKLSGQTEFEILTKAVSNLEKFYSVCHLCGMPEFAGYFKENYLYKRMWWTFNHVSKNFTLAVFDIINRKYFNGLLSVDHNHVDLFENNYTHLTQYDTTFEWAEARKNLSL